MNFQEFVDKVNSDPGLLILELGTRRSSPKVATHRRDCFKGYSRYVMSDKQDGIDVDIVADVHKLSSTFGEKSFNVILACSVLEHIKYPQLAAHEIMKTLRMNGILFLQTHQTFPLHAYPNDYCRFSADALKALFSSAMGFDTITAQHEFPARVVSERDPGTENSPAFLNSYICCIKRKETPKEYQYEL